MNIEFLKYSYSKSSQALSYSRTNLTTFPESARSAIKLGNTINPLNKSERFHTKSILSREPITIQITTSTAYILTDFTPNKAFTLTSPKKYHPRIVEKAKKSMQIAINILPNEPNVTENAACASAAPSRAPESPT